MKTFTGTHLFMLWVGLTIGNIVFQWFTDQNWNLMYDRTFFEGFAFFWLYVTTPTVDSVG